MLEGIISGVQRDNPEANTMDFVNAIIGNQSLDPDTRQGALGNMEKISNIKLKTAQAKSQTGKQFEIEYWDPEGKKPGGKKLVPASAYNTVVNQLENAGYSVQKPETKDYKSIWAFLPDNPNSWVQVEYEEGKLNESISDLAESGYRFRDKPPTEGLTGSAKNLENLLGRKPTVDELQSYGRDEADPYFSAIQTSKGTFRMNNRTGEYEQILDPEGNPVLPVSADVSLVGAKKTAEKTAEKEVDKTYSFPKARDAYQSQMRKWEALENNIDLALDRVSPYTAGVGAWVSVIPGTPQKDLSENLQTIKANIGFAELQEMRANSPTGGALGQVSEMENKLLQAVQGSLDQTQSPAELKRNLNNIKQMLRDLRNQTDFAYRYDFKDQIGTKTNAKTAEEYLKKYGDK